MPQNAVIKTPHDHRLHGLTITELVELWQSARSRAFVAEHEPTGEPDTDDYWTELAVAPRLSDEMTAGRWCVVQDRHDSASRSVRCPGVARSSGECAPQAGGFAGEPGRAVRHVVERGEE